MSSSQIISTVGFNVICFSFVSLCHKIRMYIVLFTVFPFHLPLFLHSKEVLVSFSCWNKTCVQILVNIWANKDEKVI